MNNAMTRLITRLGGNAFSSAMRRGEPKDGPDINLEELHFDKTGINARFRSPAVLAIAEHFAEQFTALGAVNYVSFGVIHDTLGPMVLTLQRTNGKTPAMISEERGVRIAELEAELTRLRAALTVAADQFTFYAEQHRAKSPPDEAKAATNDAHAERCRDALEEGNK